MADGAVVRKGVSRGERGASGYVTGFMKWSTSAASPRRGGGGRSRTGRGKGRFPGIANRSHVISGRRVNIKKVYGNRHFPVDTENAIF